MKLRRDLRAGDEGADVEAMKRMILAWRGRDGELHDFMDKSTEVRQRFQDKPWSSRVGQINQVVNGLGSVPSEVFTSKTAQWLIDHGYADSLALHLLDLDKDLVVPKIVYPVALPAKSSICQWQHVTSGIPGNVAIDFCAAAGSVVLAVEAGLIVRLSGHDPRDDTADRNGVFGWSVYLETLAGYRYFVTHLGTRSVAAGDRVKAGERIGTIGDQRFRPDHSHYGCTSPFGSRDALARILTVAGAKKVRPVD